MKNNIARLRMKQGQPALGVLSVSADPTLAELFGLAGIDVYLIDTVHGALSVGEAQAIARACESSGTTPMARVSRTEPLMMQRLLDAGLLGILATGVYTPADAAELVQAVQYPPLGQRPIGAVRVADYLQGTQTQADYLSNASEQLLVLAQLDHIEAVNNLDELLAVAGIDGFVISPRDLAMSMGHYDGPAHEDVKRTIAGAVEKINKAGLIAGTTATTGDQARALIDRGVLFCLNSLPGMVRQVTGEFMKGRS
ncbi:aldolase/citrate lyase family protein [Spirosoma luteolum]